VRLHPAPLLALLVTSVVSAQHAKPADPVAAYLGHGVSHPLAIWRAKTVRDVRYDLSLDVTAPDSAIGHVIVRFARIGTSDAVLDWRGRRLTRATANGKELPLTAANGAHIRFPARLLKPRSMRSSSGSCRISRQVERASFGRTTRTTAAITCIRSSFPPTRTSFSRASTSLT